MSHSEHELEAMAGEFDVLNQLAFTSTVLFKNLKNDNVTSDLIAVLLTSQYNLRTNSNGILFSPPERSAPLGDRSYSRTAPKLWKELPLELRGSTSVDIFNSKPKTFLYKKSHLQFLYVTHLVIGNIFIMFTSFVYGYSLLFFL